MRIKLLFQPPPLNKVEGCNVVDVISVEVDFTPTKAALPIGGFLSLLKLRTHRQQVRHEMHLTTLSKGIF